jgi:hypothetical protein
MKNIVRLVAVALLLGGAACPTWAKPLKKLKVAVSAAGVARSNAIASLDISAYEIPAGQEVVVLKADGSTALSQVDTSHGNKTIVYWRIDGAMAADATQEYTIQAVKAQATTAEPIMKVVEQSMSFGPRKMTTGQMITENGKDVLQYNTAMSRLNHGIDRSFSRNGYIHPAWSPAGNVLTNASPADHAHHYGFWNPWTHVVYDGKLYDLWNIGDKTGTVLFDTLYSTQSGNLYADLTVGHKHYIFQPQAEQVTTTVDNIIKITPKKRLCIMDEVLDMRVWNNADRNGYLWDFISDLIPSTKLPVLLQAYRYAGFGWRGTPDWTKENSIMVTSEGKNRPEIDGTNARWIYVEGMSPKGKSGILFMGYPANHNFPEPLRIWDQNSNGGRGDTFINFAPTKNEDWQLEPGQTYQLRYRMWMYDGEMTPAKAEAIWKEFANPVQVTIK